MEMSTVLTDISRKLNRVMLKGFHGFLKRFLIKDCPYRLEKIGSDYGGWVVPTNLIKPDWVCYCAGVGEDITFDLGIIERFSCNVFAFEPTPRAKKYVGKIAVNNKKFHFYQIGLWSKDSIQKFFVPTNPRFVSHSILNLSETQDFFEANCQRLSTIMQNLEHEKIDLLKMDIEGAEHEVLKSLIEDNIDIKVIGVEFEPMSFLKVIISTFKLMSYKYSLVSIDGRNYTFIKTQILNV
ncbi:methyltransferase, FkbM family protein [Coleofasciculus chthonoplastes PCC 7420]|uniref:Methyltransferase, FkbM family protein n=1 Tax=Coleofasciculus chthonoplastes PCC 7420 TaxID=118168 RepID=B4VTG8_9CYAN|nr:methyltransferase, FkbM family protein [Coleofasciculus chthonoplastes PCC 7420]